MFYFQTLCKTSQFPTLQNQNQWKWIFNFLRIIPAWGHPVPPTPTVNFTVPWTFFYHFPILTAPKAWAEQSLLLICISVRHLDRAPAFACSSNRPISKHGQRAAFYPSYNDSDLGLYPCIQPPIRSGIHIKFSSSSKWAKVCVAQLTQSVGEATRSPVNNLHDKSP